MSSHKIIVSGQAQEVRTNKYSPSTWRAAGYANGQYFEGVGLTEESAVRSWREHANYRLCAMPTLLKRS